MKYKIIVTLALICLLIDAIGQSYFNMDTIYPSGIITPNDNDLTNPINFPLQKPVTIGDINGDGFDDFAFNISYASNNLTPDITDRITKSLIVTDIENPDLGTVLYNSSIQAIGDYNGDGFDDMLDILKKNILLGNTNGTDFDSIVIDFPDEFNNIYYYNDINNDGNSDFILGEDTYSDTLLIFSIMIDSVTKFPNSSYSFCYGETMFNNYDYNSDNKNEFCIIQYEQYYQRYLMSWYEYDSVNNNYQFIEDSYINTLHEPNYSFPSGLSDINGDKIMDIWFAYYDDGFDIEVILGSHEEPHYFLNATKIEVNNASRFIYCGGDLNNDGCSDWYSKPHPDSIIIYYGNPYIDSIGVTNQTFYTGDNHFVFPNNNYFSTINPPNIFDYNHDSINDIFFNYWTFDENLQFDTIGTAIYLGDSILDFTAPLSISSTKENAFESLRFGENMKNIGDFNNDGYDDWSIIAHDACYAYIYFGGSIIDYIPDMFILLPQDSHSSCYDIAVGDLNNDNWNDIAISCSSSQDSGFEPNLISNRQNVFIFYGYEFMPPTLTYHNASVVLDGADTFYNFGMNLAVVGDYNADGYNDLVVGGGKHRDCLREAFVYLGGQIISSTPDMVISVYCTQCGIYFADPITVCGDINNDGYDDFALGDNSNGPGQSLLYFGGPFADDQYDMAIINPDSTGTFGNITPRTEGDFTGDGYPDLIQYSSKFEYIYVYEAGPQLDNIPDYILRDTSLSNYLHGFEYIKNFSTTGVSDLIVADYSSVDELLIFYGDNANKDNADMVLHNELHRSSCVISGDFDLDEHVDILTGNSLVADYGYMFGGVVQHYISPIEVDLDEIVNNNNNAIVLYPNPASSSVQLLTKTHDNEIKDIRIYDLRGKLILEKREVNNHEMTIDVSKFNAGTYILEVRTKYSSQREKLLIVN